MLGITYLRKVLDLSGDEFGELLGVNRSTVSKWESGKLEISKKKLDLIMQMFGIDGTLLERELDQKSKYSIMQAGYRYKANVLKKEFSDMELGELSLTKHEARVDVLSQLHYNDPDLMDYTERVYNLSQHRDGKSALNIVLTAVEKYLTGNFRGLAIGQTKYSSNKIRKDDLTVEAIRQMLIMTLGNQQEK